MNDFGSAFDEGQEAAERAAAARNEIDVIFKELNQQLAEKTAGKVSIQQRFLRRESSALSNLLTWPPQEKKTYWAIVATNPTLEEPRYREIARWHQDRRGYPCRLEWTGENRSCEDREALETSLADLLRDPLVAEELYAVMKSEPNGETGGS